MLDSYKTLDAALRFKISVVELMIRYELNDFDYIEQRMVQLKKEFRKEFSLPEFGNETQFVKIISLMINTVSFKSDKKIQQLMKQFISKSKENTPDEAQEIINYADWLKDKMN